MQLTIVTGREALTDEADVRPVHFVQVERESRVATERGRPDQPPAPASRPDMPHAQHVDSFDSTLAVSLSAPAFDTGPTFSGLGFGTRDGEYVPIVKVAPVYPAAAAAAGLEGYVIVEYTVTRAGTVRDTLIVESTNEVFNRPALESALGYRYKPRVIDGEPVAVPGVRTRITFALDPASPAAEAPVPASVRP